MTREVDAADDPAIDAADDRAIDAPTIDAAGAPMVLLAERAVWLPRTGVALVADVHLGKAATFRRLGVPVPETTTGATLDRLGDLVDRLRAQRLIVLGDLLHGPAARAPAVIDALAAWRAARPALEVVLVRGNHDARAGDPPAACGIALADEPLALGALRLHHEPPAAVPEGGFAVAGHLHPACRLRDRLGGLRLPCFWLRPRQLVLPAFGEFTGGHPVVAAPGDRLYPVADGRVFALPPAGSAPRRSARARGREA